MTFKLRPYQQEAVDSVVAYVKKRVSPCLLELATGAGKSLIVAELALFFATAAPKKRVLCIAPSKELVEQNAEKYLAYGYPASIYCSSAGSKCLKSQVIFASPITAAKNIEQIARLGISAIIIDEAHGVTKTMIELVDAIRDFELKGVNINEKVRVIGMTATPYRMTTGYIYAIDGTGDDDVHYDEDKAIEPYYNRLLYRVTAGELVAQGYLTKPIIGEDSEHYDTSGLKEDKFGRFSADSVSATFEGNTKTERIIQKIVAASSDRKGVIIFASTISHAEEIAGYLPACESCVITGKLRKKERADKIEAFKRREIKYLVNVDVLTTGFDAVHIDVVAILRATESPGLLQQIVGRGLRLCDGKDDCLILDYAENIKRHGLESDIFTPQIQTRIKKGDQSPEISVECPVCGCHSMKKRRSDPQYDGLAHDRFGNFLISGTEKPVAFNDEGEPIEWGGLPLTMQVLDPATKDDFGECGVKEIPIPAHYSRRCSNPEAYVVAGVPKQCGHRYSFKVCPECYAENDIAARHCTECKARLVDPNEKLTEKAGTATVMDAGEVRDLLCLSVEYSSHTSRAGSKSVKVVYKTELGAVTGWHTKNQHWVFNRLARANGIEPDRVTDYSACDLWSAKPHTVKVKKTINSAGYAEFKVQGVSFEQDN